MNDWADLDRVLEEQWLQEDPSEPDWNVEEEVMNAMKRAKAFERKILWRDRTELAAVVLIGIVFGNIAWQTPGPWTKVGAIVATVAAFWAYWPLQRARSAAAKRLDRAATTQENLVAELDRVDAQIGLLRSVSGWYMQPLRWGQVFMVAMMAASAPWPWWPERILLVVGAAIGAWLFFLPVGWGVVKMNLRASRELEVLREELSRSLVQLNDVTGPAR